MTTDTTKKVALITGANKGIGFETARQLGKQGITVLIGARDEAKGRAAADTLKQEGIDARPITLEVTDANTIEAAASRIGKEFGHLDVLVNNAGLGTFARDVPPSRSPLAEFRQIYEVNVFGVIAVTQAMLPLIRKSSAGRIVNLSSILGSMAEHSDPKSPIYNMEFAPYNTSKAALNMYTVALAAELRATPIKVNAAHPGWVKTDMGGPEAPMELPDGAKTSVWLATLPADGPTGGYFHMKDRLRW